MHDSKMTQNPDTFDADTVREAIESIHERRASEGFEGRDGARRAQDAIDAAARRLKQPTYSEYLKSREK